MDRERLKSQLRREEGERLNAYRDSLGYWTIGDGHLLGSSPEPATATAAQCDAWLEEDIDRAVHIAQSYPWYAALSDARQNVIVDLTFNLAHKLEGFHHFLAAMAAGDYAEASRQLLDSLWSKQVGHRAEVLAHELSTGEFA